jgi:hypothetical protein
MRMTRARRASILDRVIVASNELWSEGIGVFQPTLLLPRRKFVVSRLIGVARVVDDRVVPHRFRRATPPALGPTPGAQISCTLPNISFLNLERWKKPAVQVHTRTDFLELGDIKTTRRSHHINPGTEQSAIHGSWFIRARGREHTHATAAMEMLTTTQVVGQWIMP